MSRARASRGPGEREASGPTSFIAGPNLSPTMERASVLPPTPSSMGRLGRIALVDKNTATANVAPDSISPSHDFHRNASVIFQARPLAAAFAPASNIANRAGQLAFPCHWHGCNCFTRERIRLSSASRLLSRQLRSGINARIRASRKKIPAQTIIPMATGMMKVGSPMRTFVAVAPPSKPVSKIAPRTVVLGTT